MAPKRRPAAAGEAGGDRRRVRVRPAAVVPPAPAREELATGAWVESGGMAVTDLTPGKKFQIEALYWDKPVEAAAELVGVAIKAGQMEVSFRVSGTSDEQLLKWLTAEEDRVLRGHLCPAGCTNSPQSEDLIHVKRLRLLEVDTPAWAQNLKEAAEAEVLRRLAAESDRRAREARGKGVGAPAGEAAKGADTSESSGSSDSSKEKKKRKKKKKKGKKKKKKGKAWKVEGKKDLKQLFQHTGLDPDASIRRAVMKKARKGMQKKKDDSEASTGSSSGESRSASAGEELFEDSHRIRRAAMKGPGALSCQTIQNMSKYLLTAQGLPVAPREGALPAICLQYHRQVLAGRLSPPLARESLNLCAAADAILDGQAALGVDILLQRLKSVEALGGGTTWAAAQKLELTPAESSQLVDLEESRSANRELREELKNKQASQRIWPSAKGDSKSGSKTKAEESKGKGKKDKGGKDKKDREREKEK